MGARDQISRNLPTPSPAQDDVWLDSVVTRAGRLLIWTYLVAIINGALQMVALSMALQSLADGNNVVPTIVPGVVAPLGILLLLVSISMTVKLRIIQRQLSHHLIPGMSPTPVDLPDMIAVTARVSVKPPPPGSHIEDHHHLRYAPNDYSEP